MASLTSLYSEFDQLTFEVESDNPEDDQTIWIRSFRTRGDTVSLNLSRADRAKLRAALDQADAIADKGDTK